MDGENFSFIRTMLCEYISFISICPLVFSPRHHYVLHKNTLLWPIKLFSVRYSRVHFSTDDEAWKFDKKGWKLFNTHDLLCRVHLNLNIRFRETIIWQEFILERFVGWLGDELMSGTIIAKREKEDYFDSFQSKIPIFYVFHFNQRLENFEFNY